MWTSTRLQHAAGPRVPRHRESTNRRDEGFTLIELLIVVAIIGIIAAVALPGLMTSRMSANESAAIGSARAIHSAELTFATSCGGGGYANSLAQLATPPPGGQPFVSEDLRAADVPPGKSGYVLTLGGAGSPVRAAPQTCNGVGPSTTTFQLQLDPVEPGSSGTRHFFVNHSGTIWQDFGQVPLPVPTTGSPVASGTLTTLQ